MKNGITHKIVKADCLEAMKKIPDNCIDLICSDFPYNISNNGGLTMKQEKVVKADFGEWDKWETNEEYLDFVFDVCQEYTRILKRNGSLVLFFGYRFAGWIGYELQKRGLFTFRMPIIFEKVNPLPQIKKNGFRNCYEIGLWLINDNGEFSKPKTLNFLDQKVMKNVMSYAIGQSGEKLTKHPTEKPLRLISHLIEIFTNPGDIVLDSFAGSGTTGIASYKLGRHCISIEKDSSFVKMIQKRQSELDNEG